MAAYEEMLLDDSKEVIRMASFASFVQVEINNAPYGYHLRVIGYCMMQE